MFPPIFAGWRLASTRNAFIFNRYSEDPGLRPLRHSYCYASIHVDPLQTNGVSHTLGLSRSRCGIRSKWGPVTAKPPPSLDGTRKADPMRCVICGKPLRRRNRTGYCYVHCRKGGSQSVETIMRKCLRCDKEFLATGRLNRICPTCREINKEIVNASRYRLHLMHMRVGPG